MVIDILVTKKSDLSVNRLKFSKGFNESGLFFSSHNVEKVG